MAQLAVLANGTNSTVHALYTRTSPTASTTSTGTGTGTGTGTATGTKRKRSVEKKFYAVHEGKDPGIYHTWEECLANVTGHKGALCE